MCVCLCGERRRRDAAAMPHRIPNPHPRPAHPPNARPLAERHVDIVKQAGQPALLPVAGRKLVAYSSRGSRGEGKGSGV